MSGPPDLTECCRCRCSGAACRVLTMCDGGAVCDGCMTAEDRVELLCAPPETVGWEPPGWRL